MSSPVTAPVSGKSLRVLMVHNRYLVRGGEDASFDAEAGLLREGGHQVDTYVRDNAEVAGQGMLRTAVDTVWSRRSRRDVARLMQKQRYDVVHVQNFFPLISPSIYGPAREAGAAVVQSLRNYRLLCANGLLARDGKICTDCLGRSFGWPGVRHRCYRESAIGSAVVGAMAGFHRWRETWSREVDRFIVASHIAHSVFVKSGLSPDRLVFKPNVIEHHPGPDGDPRRTGAIYVGRLSAEKGVRSMVEAWLRLDGDEILTIVGDGPLEEELRSRAGGRKSIRFTGRLGMREVMDRIAQAEVLLLPTECFETFGRTVIEAYAAGTPVISTRNTAPGDLVAEGATGFLVEMGDAEGLVETLRQFRELPVAERRAMGRRAREKYESSFSRESNLMRLEAIYREAIAHRRER